MAQGKASRKPHGKQVAETLAALPDLSLYALKDQWHALYGAVPPRRFSRALLIRGIAYRLQADAFGGLSPATRRKLDRARDALAAGQTPSVSSATIKPGTRLLREWQGVTHEVIVLEEGVRYRGRTWRSLSAVAREITGARWSGPRFFGLRERPDEHA